MYMFYKKDSIPQRVYELSIEMSEYFIRLSFIDMIKSGKNLTTLFHDWLKEII